MIINGRRTGFSIVLAALLMIGAALFGTAVFVQRGHSHITQHVLQAEPPDPGDTTDGAKSEVFDVQVVMVGPDHESLEVYPMDSPADDSPVPLAVERIVAGGAARMVIRSHEAAMTTQRHGASDEIFEQSDAADAARHLLPGSFRTYQTRRFIVFSDAEANWVRLQAQHLERAAHQFERFTRRLELQPNQLRHKLVCILFNDRDAFIEFAMMNDNVYARWISGYYSPRYDRIVFYNAETNPDVHRAQESLDQIEQKLDALRRKQCEAHRNGEESDASARRKRISFLEQILRAESDRLVQHTENVIVATLIHEAIHQLFYHTGVQRYDVQYPIWFSEGMATAFETDSPGQAFGPDYEFEPRRSAFRQYLRHDALLPLQELIEVVTLTDAEAERASIIYHQCYALVTWLNRFERDGLRRYIELMQTAPSGHADAKSHRRHFEQAFGDLDALERRWIRFERSSNH